MLARDEGASTERLELRAALQDCPARKSSGEDFCCSSQRCTEHPQEATASASAGAVLSGLPGLTVSLSTKPIWFSSMHT